MTTDPFRTRRAAWRAPVALALAAAALAAPALVHAQFMPCHAYEAGSDIRARCEYSQWRNGTGGGARKALTFGAIAYAPDMRKAGTSAGEATRARAEQQALKACREVGGRDCTVGVWFEGWCGALAVAPGGAWGATSGPTRADASRGALARCARESKGEPCTVATTRCTG